MKYLLIIATLALTACTKPDDAIRLLQAQGMTEIRMTGYGWFACSEDDVFSTAFSARTLTGDFVSGSVCSGLFAKGSTIRFD